MKNKAFNFTKKHILYFTIITLVIIAFSVTLCSLIYLLIIILIFDSSKMFLVFNSLINAVSGCIVNTLL